MTDCDITRNIYIFSIVITSLMIVLVTFLFGRAIFQHVQRRKNIHIQTTHITQVTSQDHTGRNINSKQVQINTQLSQMNPQGLPQGLPQMNSKEMQCFNTLPQINSQHQPI
uniref:Uncharacterized protein n=1 Tax=Strongyloides stercoralis TaxID=6248 RepID=A0A0K0DSF7_STRER